MKDSAPKFRSDFEADVYHGLTSHPKRLSSKYFYDREGDKLFQKIMALPEYYLTDLEYEILKEKKQEIADTFSEGGAFNLIDLGAGDAKKTKLLLSHFQEIGIDFTYVPVDISKNSIEQLSEELVTQYPNLKVNSKVGTYEEVLEGLKQENQQRKVFLLLGSNIGNMIHKDAVALLRSIKAVMREKDLLLVGLDQKKDPRKILQAYNDSEGVTEAFNKNLLLRINRELNADFEVDSFLHWPVYDPEKGSMKSFLVSTKKQKVRINSLNLEIAFQPWESIHTELSQKYDEGMIEQIARESELHISHSIGDKNGDFKNYIFKTN